MGSWNKDRATKRINDRIASLAPKDIEIREYVRDTELHSLPGNIAYRVAGVHLYADILNVEEMLHTTEVEGELCHKRTLRFLNLHYRAVHRIITAVDAILVDFHNQRLHCMLVKPYADEVMRVHRAVATGQLIVDVLARTGEDVDHPAAKVRIGIDTGISLAVNNGRRGHREPLFLGKPANHAAKRSGGGRAAGIYLTNEARKLINVPEADNVDAAPLTREQIQASQLAAKLDVTADEIVKQWKDDLSSNPIGAFEFRGHTPPYSDLDIETLSAKNSRRNDAATVYSDIDGFTAYVDANIGTDFGAKNVVRALHVLRSELDAVLHADFKGRKIRFIGDCIHGLLMEGTAQNTDVEETISRMVLCAAAMRSSFDIALVRLRANGTDASSLGLAIGFEYGPMNVTRLGMKGDLIRCSVSRGVIAAEREQARCNGDETAIGEMAFGRASQAVRTVFGSNRKRPKLDYDTVVNELVSSNDKTARAVKALSVAPLLKPASAAATPLTFPDKPTGPAKPGGFA